MKSKTLWISAAALAGAAIFAYTRLEAPAEAPIRDTASPAAVENAAGDGHPDRSVSGPASAFDESRYEDTSVPEFDINGLTHYQDLLDQLGIDRDWDQWARERGLVVLLEPDRWQVYVAMDEAELRSLAEAGDALAEFAVTQKLMLDRPLEAYDRIRLLVLEGSVEAMDMMQHQLAIIGQGLELPGAGYDWSDETVAGMKRFIDESEMDLRTERMAWTLLSEVYMGQPRGSTLAQDPDLGTAPGVLPIEYGAACARARQLRDELLETWAENAVDEPSIEAPPIGFVSLSQDPDLLAACPSSELPLADLSECQPIRLRFEGTVWSDYVCARP